MNEFEIINRIGYLEETIGLLADEVNKNAEEIRELKKLIGAGSKRCKDAMRTEYVREQTNRFLDEKDEAGDNCFDGVSSDMVCGELYHWSKVNCDMPVEMTRGNKSVVSRTVSKRYGLDNINGTFRR